MTCGYGTLDFLQNVAGGVRGSQNMVVGNNVAKCGFEGEGNCKFMRGSRKFCQSRVQCFSFVCVFTVDERIQILRQADHHRTARLAFNVGPSSARQRNAILLAFRWRANDCPLIVEFGSSLPLSTKKHQKKKQLSAPSDKTFWIRA